MQVRFAESAQRAKRAPLMSGKVPQVKRISGVRDAGSI